MTALGPDFSVSRDDLVSLSSSDDCCQYIILIPSNMFSEICLGLY